MAASMGKSEGEKRGTVQPHATNRLAKGQENSTDSEAPASELVRRSGATLKELAQRLRQPSAEPPSPARLRSRKHRQHQKPSPNQEVKPPLSGTNEASRPKTVPLKLPKSAQASPQPLLRTPPRVRRLQPIAAPVPRPGSRVPPPGPSFAPKNYISAAQKPRRFNPWEVKPTTRQTSDPALRKDVNANSNSPVVKADQAISARRGSKSLPGYEVKASSPFQPPTDFSRRRENINSPVKETGSRTNRNRRSKANPASQNSPQKIQPPRRPQKPPFGPLVYIIRLLILGIGIGTIAGTLLSALNPTMPASVQRQDPAETQQEIPTPPSPSATLQLTQEIGPLKAQIKALALQNPTLKPGVFIVDLDTGSYLDLDGGILFASASTIKLPILVAFFQDVDAGKIRLDEQLTLKTEMIADGSGDLQYKKVGTPFTTLELATKMMVISDNTATNMLIERLGGMEALNQRFRSWGLTTTALRNRLPDVEGTNTTSPKELANLMSVVHRGNLVSLQSRDRLLNIMQRNEINNLLPQGLGTGAIIAHKTGNIGSLLADAGLVDLPTSKRYAIAVMVKRPFNDASAQELIRQISRKTYDYFNGTSTTPSTNPLPSNSPRTLSRAIASDTSIN